VLSVHAVTALQLLICCVVCACSYSTAAFDMLCCLCMQLQHCSFPNVNPVQWQFTDNFQI